MKIDRLETHDRIGEFQKQADYISMGCQECIDKRPKEFKNYPFYIFAHKREIGMDERLDRYNTDLQQSLLDPTYIRKYHTLMDIPTARLIWEPRLTKPSAQTNSMLFKAYPPSDNIRVIWIIPAPELWEQYTKGKMLENKSVCDSIHAFMHDRSKLEDSEGDDLPEEKIKAIYQEISKNAKWKKNAL